MGNNRSNAANRRSLDASQPSNNKEQPFKGQPQDRVPMIQNQIKVEETKYIAVKDAVRLEETKLASARSESVSLGETLTTLQNDIEKQTDFLSYLKKDIQKEMGVLSSVNSDAGVKRNILFQLKRDIQEMEKYCDHLQSKVDKLKTEHKLLDRKIILSNGGSTAADNDEKTRARETSESDKLTVLMENIRNYPFKHLIGCATEWEWCFASKQFDVASFGCNFVIEDIKKVFNPTLEIDYVTKKAQMAVQHGGENVKEVLLFRSVGVNMIEKIATEGYNCALKEAKDVMFFKSVGKCDYYFKGNQKRHVFLIKVLTCDNNKDVKPAASKNTKAPEKIFITEENSFCPLYLINYSKMIHEKYVKMSK